MGKEKSLNRIIKRRHRMSKSITPHRAGVCERSSRTQNCCAEFSARLHPGRACVRRVCTCADVAGRVHRRANRGALCVRAPGSIGSNA